MSGQNTISAVVVALLLGAAVPAGAQSLSPHIGEARNPETFGHVGRFRAGSDEGAIGSGISYGGAVTIPVWRRIAFDLDVQTGSVETSQGLLEGSGFYRTRRTLVIPGLLYRFGNKRAYGFVGGGFGAEFENSTSRQVGVPPSGQNWREIEPGIFELEQSDVSGKLSFRGGFATFVTQNLGLRGDAFIAGWHLGARIGVGYRFD